MIALLHAASSKAKALDEKENAGVLFGVEVSQANFQFARAGILLFGNRWGAPPKDEQELEKLTWEHLLLSFAAFNQNITVADSELEAEIDKTIASEGAQFERAQSPEEYERWVREKTGISVPAFEGEMRHLMQIERVRDTMRERIKERLQVTDAEAFEKFLREQHTLSVELAQFDELGAAEEFFRKTRRSRKYWQRYKKSKPENFKSPGFVSLEFLIDLWGVPRDAAFGMMRKEIGDIYPPQPIYKGYAVFKVLEKRTAEEKSFEERKQGYLDKVREIRAHEEVGNWIEHLKKEANITVY